MSSKKRTITLNNVEMRKKTEVRSLNPPSEKDVDILVSELQRNKTINKDIWRFKHISDLANVIDYRYSDVVAKWRDDSDLDLIHYCILYNGSHVLEKLLSADVPPDSHKPLVCPYAHLAAILNHSSCLRIVLTYRPNDFFAVVDPQQSRIPVIIRKRVNLTANNRFRADAGLNAKTKQVFKNAVGSSQTTDSSLDFNIGNDVEPEMSVVKSGAPSQMEETDLFESKLKMSTKPAVRILSPGPTVSMIYNPFSDLREEHGILGGSGVKINMFQEVMSKQNSKDEPLPCTFQSCGKLPSISSSGPQLVHSNKSSNRKTVNCNTNQNAINNNTFWTNEHTENKSYNNNRSTGTTSGVVSDDIPYFLNETPLTIAASRGFFSSVKVILEIVIAKQYDMDPKDPLTLATKAKAASTLTVLVEWGASFQDFQNAVDLALVESSPECLAVLLTKIKGPDFRRRLFNGENLFNRLLFHNDRMQIDSMSLPIMTTTLIACQEPFKYQWSNSLTYPVYTFIRFAFNDARPIYSQYLQSFEILMEHGAEPDAKDYERLSKSGFRDKFATVGECILSTAVTSRKCENNPDIAHKLIEIFMKKLLDSFCYRDKRNIRDTLICYMKLFQTLGLHRSVLNLLLRNGADPNECKDGLYPVNIYFEYLFSFLERHDISDCMDMYVSQVDILMVMCERMRHKHLHNALIRFMDKQIIKAGFQGSYIAKYFCHVAGRLMVKPRTLSDLSANIVWYKKCNRKYEEATKLTSDKRLLSLIIP